MKPNEKWVKDAIGYVIFCDDFLAVSIDDFSDNKKIIRLYRHFVKHDIYNFHLKIIKSCDIDTTKGQVLKFIKQINKLTVFI